MMLLSEITYICYVVCKYENAYKFLSFVHCFKSTSVNIVFFNKKYPHRCFHNCNSIVWIIDCGFDMAWDQRFL